MNSPLESLAAFVITFILGIIFAVGLDIYTRVIAKRKDKSQQRSFQTT